MTLLTQNLNQTDLNQTDLNQTNSRLKSKSFRRVLAIFLVSALFGTPAFASKFANQFVEFELPPQWQCSLEGSEWVCQSSVEAKKREAIIILAAKLKGDQDSIDQYQSYLKNPKTYTSVQGKPVTSEVKYSKLTDINSQQWVDSLQLNSEIPGFYTRYLATIKVDIGVLVTYSINIDKYQLYMNDFDTLIRTLRVFRKGSGGINAGGNLFDIAIPKGISEGTVFPPAQVADAPAKKAKGGNEDLYLYGAIGVAVILFLLRKKKRD